MTRIRTLRPVARTLAVASLAFVAVLGVARPTLADNGRRELSKHKASTNGGPLFTINQPGSYVLTSDLTIGSNGGFGILVNASEVTIDLNGFTIYGPQSQTVSSIGIDLGSSSFNNVVKNGTIRSCSASITTNGFGHVVENVNAVDTRLGISIRSGIVRGCRVQVLKTGTLPAFGIVLDMGGLVERCVVASSGSGDQGIRVRAGRVAGCTVEGFDIGVILGRGTVADSSIEAFFTCVRITGAGDLIAASVTGSSLIGATGIDVLNIQQSKVGYGQNVIQAPTPVDDGGTGQIVSMGGNVQ